ncbi:MAG TPA: deaminase [Xanthobacteraceae bacterium]|nr:deaminase [Xanthobacteraceae bacterium]
MHGRRGMSGRLRSQETCACTRRAVLALAAVALLAPRAKAAPPEHQEFIEAAFRMKDEAVRAGDQAFGAVVVKDRRIIGFGPSRVILRRDWTAHAEREAMREAQARLGSSDLRGCLLYSTSRPCSNCEAAAAAAGIARMFHGGDATDAGVPRA